MCFSVNQLRTATCGSFANRTGHTFADVFSSFAGNAKDVESAPVYGKAAIEGLNSSARPQIHGRDDAQLRPSVQSYAS